MKKTAVSPIEAFRINMQIIVDALEEAQIPMRFQAGNDYGRLIGARIYHGQSDIDPEYVYLACESDLTDTPPQDGTSFLISGTMPKLWENVHASIIELNSDEDLLHILDLVQDVFEKHRKWDERLQYALNHDKGITELCKISVDFFNNPLFVHDAGFYILECPIWHPAMNRWEWDERTQMHMLSLDLVNEYKVDSEYVSTLATKGAQIFSANIRGYRILYVNMWDSQGRYEGRLCINELLSPLKPGHFLTAEHLVKVIQIAYRRRNLKDGSFTRPFDLILGDIIDHVIADVQTIKDAIVSVGWKIDDRYACIKLTHNEHILDNMVITSTCHHIEKSIAGSYAFRHNNTVVMILNLSVNNSDFGNCLTQLAYIIREGLFKAGVSNIYQDFSLTHDYYRQAELALEYGEQHDSTLWCHHFGTYVLKYMMDRCCLEFPSELLCPEGLHTLQQYDARNETELYKTLKTYLKNDRRTTQTANELYVHRSTLFYRLDRIDELLQIDLNDPYKRLYINMCIYLLENKDSH